ncbi:hypothetical protein F5Y10DRAFT_120669 [Nemania abortiva]|nr:hypothetical protein F5Y10DRAFT_120669 [Nemania abortiva]
MQLSVEAIIAIIALFVALPPTIALLVQFYYHHRSKHVSSDESQGVELGLGSRGPSTSRPPLSLQNPPWRTASIQVHMLFEEAGQRQLLEISPSQPSRDQSNMPLLENNQSTFPNDE